jgi:signal transduction histidine kinase
MQTLVDDILTLSKLSNSDFPNTRLDLNNLIHHIIDDLEITIKERSAIINAGPLPVITGVTGQIHQLFLNLVVNGLKFNTSKRPEISIYEQPVTHEDFNFFDIDDRARYAGIIVRDNGIGFDPIYAEKIFGIFQRLSGAQYPGTGIGLAICKKIVENHNGFIRAVSKEGEGTRFIIALPK